MAETFGFYDAEELVSGEFDREYLAQQFNDYFALFISNGVFASPTNQLKVVAGTGMKIIVKEGWAFINGHWYHNGADLELTVPANITAQTVHSGVFIQASSAERTIAAKIATGRTEVDRESPLYELKLAELEIPTGTTAMTDALITDTRSNENVCGFVTGLLSGVIPTEDLFAQYDSMFTSWYTQQTNDFADWFQYIKDQLSEDAAGNLQNEIDALTAKVVAEPVTSDRFELFDTFEGSALAHTIYGMSEQDGTPTPTNPVDIVSAEANFKCMGKNLIPYPYSSTVKTDAGITFTPNIDGSICIVGTSTGTSYFVIKTTTLDFKPNTEYTLSLDVAGTGQASIFIQKASADLAAIRGASVGHTEVDFTTGSAEDIAGYRQVGIYISSSYGAVNLVVRPMVRLKNASQNYEPYHEYEADTDLVLRAIEVSSTDDYNLVKDGKYYVADTIEWSEDEGYKLIRRVESLVFDGSENWEVKADWTGNFGQNFGITTANLKLKNPHYNIVKKENDMLMLSNAMIGNVIFYTPDVNEDRGNGIYRTKNYLYIQLNANTKTALGITSLESFKTWMANNNIEIILRVPAYTEPITSQQAKALLGLQTYNGATLIESTADVAPVVKLEYGRTQNEAYALTGHNVAKSDKLNLTANDGLEFQFASSGGEHGYLDENGVFKAFKTTHTETKTINNVGTTDMGVDHKYRYVETEGLMAIPTAKKTITANGNNQDVLNYEKADIQVPPHYKLVGTYSANANVNVSQYGATSAGQFLLVPVANQSAYYTQVGKDPRTTDWPAGYARFYVGSLSLSGSTLSVTLPSVRVEVYTGDSPWPSATSYIQCRLYFIGNAS